MAPEKKTVSCFMESQGPSAKQKGNSQKEIGKKFTTLKHCQGNDNGGGTVSQRGTTEEGRLYRHIGV